MGLIESLAGVLFQKVIGGIVKAIMDARRDAALRKLGHAESEIEHMRSDRVKAKEAQKIYDEIHASDMSIDDILDRM